MGALEALSRRRRLGALTSLIALCVLVGCTRARPRAPLTSRAVMPAVYASQRPLDEACVQSSPRKPLHYRSAVSPMERAQSFHHHIEGVALLERHEPEEAAHHLRLAYELEPRAKLLYLLGRAYEQQGRPDYALGAYEAYLRSDWRDARSCELAVASIREIRRLLRERERGR